MSVVYTLLMTNTVWILWNGTYEERKVLGVFSSEEAAHRHIIDLAMDGTRVEFEGVKIEEISMRD